MVATTPTQRRVRYAAAAIAAFVAALYLLTGFGIVSVVDDQPAGIVPPLLIAGLAFALLPVLLTRVARRWLWFTGAALQVLVISMYVVVAADRSPAYEAWGVTVKVLQFALLGTLVWLAVRPSPRTVPGSGNRGLSPV